MPDTTMCEFPGCDRGRYGRKPICSAHYQQQLAGKPLRPVRRRGLTTEERFWTHVDKSGDCWRWTGYLDANGYGRYRFDGEARLAHRVAWTIHYGSCPDLLDHICHTRACVRTTHLRPLNKSGNGQNLSGIPAHNSSGYRNVYYESRSGKWVAELKVAGHKLWVGKFSDVHEAGRAAAEARAKHYRYSQW